MATKSAAKSRDARTAAGPPSASTAAARRNARTAAGPPSASTAAKSRNARTVVARWPRRNEDALVMNARGGVSPAVPWSRTAGFGRHPFCLSSRADTVIRATHQNQGLFTALGPHPLILPPPARACRRRACTREPPPPVASVWRLGRGRAAMRDALPHAGRERACAPAAMHRPAALRPSAATGRPATSPAARPAARPLGGWVVLNRVLGIQPLDSCRACRLFLLLR